MCECKDMSMDMKTPRNAYLSAFYKRSFAYHTVKNRMPVILTQILDNLSRNKDTIAKEFGEEAREDLKLAISELSKFKYEVQTNKPLTKLMSSEPDVALYNEYIDKQAAEEGETTHFNTIWLLTECYMYRRIKEIFVSTDKLKDFDYFLTSKVEQFEKSKEQILHLSKYVTKIGEDMNTCDRKKEILKMLKINLWGNKCDLSISLGKVDGPGQLHEADDFEPFVLADDCERIHEILTAPMLDQYETVDVVLDNAGYELFTNLCLMDFLSNFRMAIYRNIPGFHFLDVVLDNAGYELFTDLCLMDFLNIVLDNAGYELFTDLCLMDFLSNFCMAKKVRFHVKTMPWFISDVTENDFHWTLQQLCESEDVDMKCLGVKWKEMVQEGVWTVVAHPFWTSPYEFKFMEELAPELYKSLTSSKLVFFKGDLNYRKLFGERNWDPTTPVEEALQGFLPTRICTLRTIKADIVVGLKPGVAEECEKKDPKWMEAGDYGLIQFADKQVKGC